jgi:hypothetical protein
MFGDIQAVVTNSTIPHSLLNKRHNAFSYHRVHEMIAAKDLACYWIDGKKNLLKPFLFLCDDIPGEANEEETL